VLYAVTRTTHRLRLAVWLLLGCALAFAVWGGVNYRRDRAAAFERVRGGARTVETACGAVEYAEAGEGPPALVVHGAGGGYDQGLLLGMLLMGRGHRLIAPSRFGFLGSPVLGDGSIAAQTDTFQCLLDALGVGRATVLGISAGGPSTQLFAVRHGERTQSLVQVSAVSLPATPPSWLTGTVTDAFLRSDLVYWLLLRHARGTLIAALGVTPELQARLSAADRAEIDRMLEQMSPMSPRSPGTLRDQELFVDLDIPLERIAAPTLVVHARDDTLVGFEHAEHSVGRIPGAALLPLDDGGHFLAGRHAEIRAAVAKFLARPGRP
jgi:pimeloyl-ACP methyl ester carboxylesterase